MPSAPVSLLHAHAAHVRLHAPTRHAASLQVQMNTPRGSDENSSLAYAKVRRRLLHALGWSEGVDTDVLLFSLGLVEVQALSLIQTVKEMLGGKSPSPHFLLASSINAIAEFINKSQAVGVAGEPTAIFLFTGEGAHCVESDLSGLRASPSWDQMETYLQQLGVLHNLSLFLEQGAGVHTAPHSPLITTIINILNVDRWRLAGHEPSIVIGHSIGEVAAAYVAGLLSLDDALLTALGLGQIGSQLSGAMLHTRMSQDCIDDWKDCRLCIAAINGQAVNGNVQEDACWVTLCGAIPHIEAWIACDPHAKKMHPKHPWHHASYSTVTDLEEMLAELPKGTREHGSQSCRFVSSIHVQVINRVDADYWRAWLTNPGMRGIWTLVTWRLPVQPGKSACY